MTATPPPPIGPGPALAAADGWVLTLKVTATGLSTDDLAWALRRLARLVQDGAAFGAFEHPPRDIGVQFSVETTEDQS
jgi:hypothetical protein